jgi:inhibitor of cysteine peptidase
MRINALVKLMTLACLAVNISSCGDLFKGDDGETKGEEVPDDIERVKAPLLKFELTNNTYESCDAIQKDVHDYFVDRNELLAEAQKRYEKKQKELEELRKKNPNNNKIAYSESVSDDTTAVGGSEEGFTNSQEEGVSESDYIKIGKYQIFTIQSDLMQVVDRKSLKLVGSIEIGDFSDVQMYSIEDKLLLVGNQFSEQEENDSDCNYAEYGLSSSEPYYNCGQKTAHGQVQQFKLAKGKLPKHVNTQNFTGVLTDSRLTGGRLITVLSDNLPLVEDEALNNNTYGYTYKSGVKIPKNPIKIVDDLISGVACNKVSIRAVRDNDFRITNIFSLDPNDITNTDASVSMLGGGDQIYMTQNSLYITKYGLNWIYGWFDYEHDEGMSEQLIVSKVNFDPDSGKVGYAASGIIKGRVKDQWAFKEYSDGSLSIMTSTGQLWSQDENIAQNHLWVLEQKDTVLDEVGGYHDFGTGEDIRSVRYIEDMAYVVTFKKTDPLFAFDMSTPTEPALLGELKIPGFSVYMHPIGDNRMVGLGFDAADQGDFAYFQGIQVSIFDVNDPKDMKRTSNEILGDRGSKSEATGDHHAFFYDEETSMVGFPLVEVVKSDDVEGYDGQYGNKLKFSGAILYNVENELEEVARVTHRDLLSEECIAQLSRGQWWSTAAKSYDINRIFKVDGNILTISRFGMKVHNLSNPEEVLKTIKYSDVDGICSQNMYYY